MPMPLLQTKLYIPPPRLQLVSRPAVTAKLDAGLLHPVTLIAAPAGFGKTTLVSEWIAQIRQGDRETGRQGVTTLSSPPLPVSLSSPLDVAWLSLNEDDNDPTRFLTYVMAALQTQQPELGASAQGLLGAPDEPPPKAILTLLLNELGARPAPLILVLDDYHLITTPAIHEALTFFVDHLPPSFHLVITSRVDPPLPLARWRVRNQLTELRAEALRFRPEEVATFLNEVMGLMLTADNIATLETRTEGWIAGLQLAALSMQGRADVAGFIQAFSGSHRHVLSYLVEEVLNRAPEGTLNFLLHTSLLERLTPALCNAVTARNDSLQLLKRVEQANLFLIPLDDEGHWYRYHHLFAEVLRTRLYETQPAVIPALQQRASAWYEQQELWSEAIHHALAVDDFARVAHLIEHIGITLFAQTNIQHALNRWLSTLPVDLIRARPRLCLIYAWILHAHMDTIAALHWVTEAEAAWQRTPTDRANAPVLGEIAAMRARLAVTNPSFTPEEAAAWGQQALATLSPDQATFRSIAALAVGHAYVNLGDVTEAEQMMAEASRMGRAAGNVYLYVSGAASQAILQRALGALGRAQATCEEALAWVSQHNALAYPIVGGLYLNLADLLREQNELATAQHYAEIAVARTDQEVNPASMFILSRLVLLRVKQAQGDWSRVWDLLQEVATQAAKYPTIIHHTILPAMTAQFQLARGIFSHNEESTLADAWAWARASAWQEGGLSLANRMLGFIYLYEHSRIARAQVFIAWARATNDQPLLQETLTYLERQRQIAETARLRWFQIKVHLLQALAYHTLGDKEPALTALTHALHLAGGPMGAEGFVRVFVDEGTSLRLLILDFGFWISQQPHTEQNAQLLIYLNKLLANFGNAQSTEDTSLLGEQPSIQNPKSKIQNLVEPLSDRELEVLQLIVAGLSNHEIAGRLIISTSTVKTHINRIFGKLAVQSRTQALVRARELGLLPS